MYLQEWNYEFEITPLPPVRASADTGHGPRSDLLPLKGWEAEAFSSVLLLLFHLHLRSREHWRRADFPDFRDALSTLYSFASNQGEFRTNRSRAYLERARAQASSEVLKVEFVESDARSFSRAGSFDAAISMLTSFGYFEDPADDLKVMQNLHTALRSGGHLLIDLNGKEVIARNFREREWWQHDDGTLVLQERKIRSGWDWMDSRWILVVEGGKTWEGTISTRLYSGVELKELLRSAGFSAVKLHGNLTGASYDERAERLIAVATK